LVQLHEKARNFSIKLLGTFRFNNFSRAFCDRNYQLGTAKLGQITTATGDNLEHEKYQAGRKLFWSLFNVKTALQ